MAMKGNAMKAMKGKSMKGVMKVAKPPQMSMKAKKTAAVKGLESEEDGPKQTAMKGKKGKSAMKSAMKAMKRSKK